MGACLVLTPLVVAAWPTLAAAIVGAAASMGYAVNSLSSADLSTGAPAKVPRKKKVETEIENSGVVAEGMVRGEKIVVHREGVTIEFGRDERGACSVCVTGEHLSERELKKIGAEVAGRVVQQFAYHKLMTELKQRNYSVVEEKSLQDGSIQVRVRL